jgi:hypothetical protein
MGRGSDFLCRAAPWALGPISWGSPSMGAAAGRHSLAAALDHFRASLGDLVIVLPRLAVVTGMLVIWGVLERQCRCPAAVTAPGPINQVHAPDELAYEARHQLARRTPSRAAASPNVRTLS